jgi:diacylglycerol diphosphate phosphatase/phosphatidate phosphatase
MFRRRWTMEIADTQHSTHSLLDENRKSAPMHIPMETDLATCRDAPEEVEAISTSSSRYVYSVSSFSYFTSRDFIELLGCLGFLLLFGLLTLISFEPNQRPIPYQILENSGDYVRNLTNNELFDGETVPDILLIFLAIVAPALIQFALSKQWGRLGDGHATLCVYITAFTIVLATTDAVKMYVGYLRPIFYELCEPDDEYQECNAEDGGGNSIRMSFPSGHASTSFCGLVLLSLYLHSRFGVPSVRVYKPETTQNGLQRWTTAYSKEPQLYRAISVLSLLPLALALFIATSRLVDNKHFPADVVGGSVLGASVAVFTHGLWYS